MIGSPKPRNKRSPNTPIPKSIGEWVAIDPTSPTGLRRIKAARPQSQYLVGRPIGSASRRKDHTYYRFSIGGRSDQRWFWNHRVIYFLHYGEDPGDLEIDFIDNNSSNLDPSNLRKVTKAQQMWNSEGHINPLVPIKGLRIKDNGNGGQYWEASFQVDGVRHQKTFPLHLEEDAVAWIKEQRQLHHGVYARHTSRDEDDPAI